MNKKHNYRETTPYMRLLLYIASGLVFTVGIPLILLPRYTDQFFSWTIAFPLTAVFLGASYWSSFLLEFLSAREQYWARARTAIPAVTVFTTLTLILTLLHFSKFQHGAEHAWYTRVGTWVWILVYLSVPIIMGTLWWQQRKLPGVDLPRTAPFAGWLQKILFFQTGILVSLGTLFFLMPTIASSIWPWPLPIIAARAVGAWLIGLGIAAGQTAHENDYLISRNGLISYLVFGIFQLLAVIVYATEPLPNKEIIGIAWDGISIWLYLLFLLSIILSAGFGIYQGRHHLKESY